MPAHPAVYKRETLNQLINFFWTVLCFAPILWFWITEGINIYFYLFLVFSLALGILPEKMLNLLTLSSKKRFYERMGVKQIRRFVQNGDLVKSVSTKQKLQIVNNLSQALQFKKTIAMYERFHWICFTFFLLSAILCITAGRIETGLIITAANLLYNVSSILLQQYNKIRIRKFAN